MKSFFKLKFNSNKFLRKTVTLSLFYIFVAIGCFWQIVSICGLYFNYPTIVSIETEYRECENELPALSFCTRLEERISEFENSTKTVGHYAEKFNVSKVVFNMSIINPRYEVIKGNRKGEDIQNSLIQTINSIYTCFTFNSLLSSKREPVKLKKNEILRIKLNLEPIRNQAYLYLHDWYSLPTGWSWDTIEIKNGSRYAVSFERKVFQLLKKPYVTDCVDYLVSTPYKSRQHCLTICRLKTNIKECGVIPDETNVELNETEQFGRFSKDDKCTERLNLTDHCWGLCPQPDCDKHFIKAVKHYETALCPTQDYCENVLEMDPKFEAIVIIRIPSEPQTLYTHKPKLETIEFLCYCASLIGLWFGISIASIYVPLKRFIPWFHSKRELRKGMSSYVGRSFCLKKRLLMTRMRLSLDNPLMLSTQPYLWSLRLDNINDSKWY